MSMARSMAIIMNGAAAPAINVSLSDYTFDNEAEVGPVSASFTFGNTGILSGDVFTIGSQPVQQWLDAVDGPTAALYSVMFTKISGDTPTAGTLDTWLNLGTNRTVTNTRATRGFMTTVLNTKIKLDSSGAEIANVTLTLQARVWPPITG